MKKLSFLMSMIMLAAVMFTSCDKKKGGGDADNIVEDGFYVIGEAVGIATLSTTGANKTIMANGFNEADENALRDGMYEKYVYLTAGKTFSLVLKEGSSEIKYGAALTEVNLADEDGNSQNDQPAISILKGSMAENATLQVSKTGLYHIVLDLNKKGDLTEKQILIAPVEFGVRGGMNGWGFTAFPTQEMKDGKIAMVLEGQELATGGEFKFAYGKGWKIQLDAAGAVKANTNIGKDSKPGGDNIKVEKGGLYKITFTYELAQGSLANCFKYTVELTQESTVPTEMYMIGGDFGNWTWTDAGVVALKSVHGKAGHFWTINYFNAASGFKFSPVKAWNGDFTGLVTNTGYEVRDGNCFVAADGLYMVYINLIDGKITIEPAAVYGIGDAFGGWDEAMAAAKFAVSTDGKSMSATTIDAGKLRMYAASSLSVSGWWTREFNIFDGKIEYRGAGGDQAEVPVTAGQVVTLDFATGTGSIK